MAISTYSELQTEIIDWSHRSDLAARIPNFIQLAEASFNTILLSRLQEFEVELTGVTGSRYTPLPTDYYQKRFLWITEFGTRDELDFKIPEKLCVNALTSRGYPNEWTIDGANIAFDCLAQSAFTFDFRYAKKITLSDANPTNWLLTDHPDIYLNGAMVQLCIFTRNLDMLKVWKPMYDQILKDVQSKEMDNESLATLDVDRGLMARRGSGYNIRSGRHN